MKKQVSEEQKLAKFIDGSARSLILLAKEIKRDGFTTSNKKLLTIIGSRLVFESAAFTWKKD